MKFPKKVGAGRDLPLRKCCIFTQASNKRRGWESNPRIAVLQTAAFPLGHRAADTILQNLVDCFQKTEIIAQQKDNV